MAIERKISRRKLFSGAAALAGGAALLQGQAPLSHARKLALIGGARVGESDGGVLIDDESLTQFALPGRAHAMARLATGEVVLMGRRPGTFAAIVDRHDPARAARVFAPEAGFRFAGHAAVSPDGQSLATSEIDASTGDGVVVVRHAVTGMARARLAVGIEPHDLLYTNDGARLIVALGGIARAADVKGPAINAGAIESAVVELDARTGAVLKRHVLGMGFQSLSLRHMAKAPDGKSVVIGMQDQDRSELRPLMGVLRLGRGVELLELPREDAGGLRFYIGSVAVDASGRYAAATSPKGGMVGLWSLANGAWLGGFASADVCGLTADAEAGYFWASSGLGQLLRLGAGATGLTEEARWHVPLAFDNHMLRI